MQKFLLIFEPISRHPLAYGKSVQQRAILHAGDIISVLVGDVGCCPDMYQVTQSEVHVRKRSLRSANSTLRMKAVTLRKKIDSCESRFTIKREISDCFDIEINQSPNVTSPWLSSAWQLEKAGEG